MRAWDDCDEAEHWMRRLERAAQVGRREEVKVAASENRTLSESVRASGARHLKKKEEEGDNFNKKNGFRGYLFCAVKVNGCWRAESHPGGHTSPNAADRPERSCNPNFCKGLSYGVQSIFAILSQ